MKRLEDSRLYGIIDLGYVGPADVLPVASQMIQGGIDLIQLRAKKYVPDDIRWLAEQLHAVTFEAGIPLIINDVPEVVRDVNAEGLHIGQDDLPVERARSIAGYRSVLGKSTHSIAQAMAAAGEETDYLAFGPLFATATKPDYTPVGLQDIRTIHEMIQKPIFCIGGITLENLPSVLEAGARRVVIVSGILKAPDITAYCRQAKSMLPPI